jgi:head-tail adaptor
MSSGMTALLTVERETVDSGIDSDEQQDWASVGSVRAEVKPIRFSESERQGAMRTTKGYLFRVYTAAVRQLAITEADRFVWDGITFNIREVRIPEARTRFTEIVAEAGVTQ